jgi:hypothetical protein
MPNERTRARGTSTYDRSRVKEAEKELNTKKATKQKP